MAVNYNPRTITDGLILYLDAANKKSYSGSGTTWTDLIGSKTSTLTNGPTYSSTNLGSIVFDGINDYVAGNTNLTLDGLFTISLWVKHNNSVPVQERYITLGSDRIVVQENDNADLNLYVTDGTQQQLWNWGRNSYGYLGVNDTFDRSTPVTTILGGINWKFLDVGTDHTSVIKTDGTLWVWGFNSLFQLGINDTTERSTPVTTILGGTNWKSVSGGGTHTAAIKTDGTLWTWGNNSYGGLGINSTIERSTPVTTILGGTNWKSISSGFDHIAAIKTDGTLWVLGANNFGQLGINDTTNRSIPVTTILGGTNWKFVSSGQYQTAAIKTDGTLWTWGLNFYGNLGINDTKDRSTPVTTILGGTNWKSVSGGSYQSAAIKTDGTLWTWGNNSFGNLGINATTNRSTPVTTILGGTNWKSVAGGGNHIAAIKTDGTLWVWGGNNNYVQLGINNNVDKSTPVTTMIGGTNWKSVSCGGYHTVAIKTDGTFINDISTNASISNSSYYNIVATCNGTTLNLYQNTTLVSTATLGGTLSSTDLSYTISSALEAFSGNLYNVMVYNKALTTSEITENFNSLRWRFGI